MAVGDVGGSVEGVEGGPVSLVCQTADFGDLVLVGEDFVDFEEDQLAEVLDYVFFEVQLEVVIGGEGEGVEPVVDFVYFLSWKGGTLQVVLMWWSSCWRLNTEGLTWYWFMKYLISSSASSMKYSF